MFFKVVFVACLIGLALGNGDYQECIDAFKKAGYEGEGVPRRTIMAAAFQNLQYFGSLQGFSSVEAFCEWYAQQQQQG